MKKSLHSPIGAIALGIVIAISVAATSSLMTGCSTTGGSTTPGTIDTNKLQKGAILLKSTVSSSVIVATDKDTNAVVYIKMVGGLLDAIIGGTDYTPAKIEKAISELNIKELKKPEARIAINTVLSLYEIYYGDYVRGRLEGNQTALVLLGAIRDGINQGLGTPSPP